MSKGNIWISSLALAFSAAAGGLSIHNYLNPPQSPVLAVPSAAVNDNVVGIPELVTAVMPAIVNISSYRQSPKGGGDDLTGMGTGFIIDGKSGYILTNQHVVENSTNITVSLNNKHKFKARLVGLDDLSDLAVLKIEADTALPQMVFADSNTVRVGDPVIAIGHPFRFSYSVTQGIVSAVNRDDGSQVRRLIQNDASVNPGNSGGPLFNRGGRVIGINNVMFSPGDGSVGISFAIPSNQAKKVADTLIADGKVRWGFMGIQMKMTKDGPNKAIDAFDEPQNIRIENVIPGSPAEAAGLRAGDIITSVNGKFFDNISDLSYEVMTMMAGGQA